jgi:AraC-like DNA-binding protein
MEDIVQIQQFAEMKKNSADFSQMGENYIFSRLSTSNRDIHVLNSPLRFNGLTFFMCRQGSLKVEINLEHFSITPHSLMIIAPGSMFQVEETDWENLDGDLLFISTSFLNDINIDINALSQGTLIGQNRQDVMNLSPEEFNLLIKYFELLHKNNIDNSSSIFSTNIARTLVAATIYQVLQFASTRTPKDIEEPTDGTKSRRMSYVHDFIRLVHQFHRQERGVSFYAEKLFISPKYLSLLVKEATGRSAANWIDSFVILEAKNLLRFSGKNIQQVAYELNFSNQSAFGKLFKNLTGMSPTEYQKS